MAPPHLTPEYIAANSNGGLVYKMSIFAAVATIVAALRIWLRLGRKVTLWLDDYLLILSVAFLWAFYVVCVLCVQHGGLGRHIVVLIKTSPHTLDNMDVYFYTADFLYASCLATVKCSILALYWRIFPTKFIRRSTAFLATLVLAWWLGCVFVSLFQCKPIRKAWMPLVKGTCVNHFSVFIGKAVPNFSIDFLILCLPTVEIFKLNIRKAQKVALILVFAFGALACISSVVRFKIVYTQTKYDPDPTWVLPNTFFWTIAEVSIAIISACLPPLSPIFSWAVVHLTSFQSSLSGRKGSDHNDIRDITTIGGGGKARKVRARDPDTLNFSKDSPSIFDNSSEQLPVIESHEVDTVGLLRNAYRGHQRTKVQGGSGNLEYVPMHKISVKTEISSQEMRPYRDV